MLKTFIIVQSGSLLLLDMFLPRSRFSLVFELTYIYLSSTIYYEVSYRGLPPLRDPRGTYLES